MIEVTEVEDIIALWDSIREFVPAKERDEAATAFVTSLEDRGVELAEFFTDLSAHDDHLNVAMIDHSPEEFG